MPAIELTPAARKEKRGEAHHLDPVVLIGAEGLTPAVVRETDAALKAHGLIKVRVFSDDRTAREAMLAQLADELDAAAVQHIGKLLVLWRPIPEKPKDPNASRNPGTRLVKLVTPSKSGTRRPTVKVVEVFGNQHITPGGLIKRSKKRPTTSTKRKAQSRD